MKKIAISLIIIAVTIAGGVIAWNLWDSNNNKQAQTNTSNYQAQRSSTNTPSNSTNTNIANAIFNASAAFSISYYYLLLISYFE